ncbi:MAG TPA: hypothetical protein VGH92_07920 [Gaiellaceae bacterium]|jgi:hypothetical protein
MRTLSARLLLALAICVAAAAAGATSALAGGVSIPVSGTGGPHTGSFTPSGAGGTTDEFPGDAGSDASPDPYSGNILDRSLSRGPGHAVSVSSNARSKSNPTLGTSFEGLNIYDQRYARGGNQFTVEPPDQGLCAGNGYVVEFVNDVMNVYNTAGQSVLPDNTATNVVSGYPRDVHHAVDLNSFYGYQPAINRSTGVRAQFVTDPSCLYDAQTNRWFAVVLTLETYPNGAYTHQNHIDIAVSTTADPTGTWNIYRVDVTNDGSNPSAGNACPCLGDYPHIGADANGFYVTTNSYPWNGNGFDGAQIYAFSKAQLAAGGFSVSMEHFDTFGRVNAPSDAGSTQPGFTVWPAQSPAGQFDAANGGTEYFLSSNAADEATHPVAGSGGTYTSNQIVQWTLANTSSLNAVPALSLASKVIDNVDPYAIPPKQHQPGAGTPPGTDVPQGHCINDTTTSTIAGTGCWRLLFGGEPAHDEVISTPDSNDTRMQQVTFANGKLWGSLDTAVTLGSGNRAGIAYYVVNPSIGKVAGQGYLAQAGMDLVYPAIGVLANGRGVIAFTATGDSQYPSSGYASLDALTGAGAVQIAGSGAADDDGFTSYKAQVGSPPRTRWGDYSATAVDGNSIWIASEYISAACNYTTWGGPFFTGGSGDNLLGTCAGTSHGHGERTSIGNWSTRVSQLKP